MIQLPQCWNISTTKTTVGRFFSPSLPTHQHYSPICCDSKGARSLGWYWNFTRSDKINQASLRCWINKQYTLAWGESSAPCLSDVTDCSFSPLIKRRVKYTGVITFCRKNTPNPWKIISKMIWIGRVSGVPHCLWKDTDTEISIKDWQCLTIYYIRVKKYDVEPRHCYYLPNFCDTYHISVSGSSCEHLSSSRFQRKQIKM